MSHGTVPQTQEQTLAPGGSVLASRSSHTEPEVPMSSLPQLMDISLYLAGWGEGTTFLPFSSPTFQVLLSGCTSHPKGSREARFHLTCQSCQTSLPGAP